MVSELSIRQVNEHRAQKIWNAKTGEWEPAKQISAKPAQVKITMRIDDNGSLTIKRADVMKTVICPFNDDGQDCGDWCALFREPVVVKSGVNGVVSIKLCHMEHTVKFTQFEDRRL